MAKAKPRPFRFTRRRREMVEQLVACGQTVDQIARAFGIPERLLRTACRDELRFGRARALGRNACYLRLAAAQGSREAQDYLLRTDWMGRA